MIGKPCDIDICPDQSSIHVPGYPDCLDLCDQHARANVRNADEFDRTQRLAGCEHIEDLP